LWAGDITPIYAPRKFFVVDWVVMSFWPWWCHPYLTVSNKAYGDVTRIPPMHFRSTSKMPPILHQCTIQCTMQRGISLT
jgi:hypothetical protein